MAYELPGMLRYLPNPSLVPRPEIPRTLALLKPNARLCDIGGGGRRIAPGVVTVDIVPGPNVDIVSDIHELQIPDESFDCVFCTGTLEHVRDPWKAVRELHRILRPEGLVHIDVPFIQPYHPDPTDYWRFTLDGLRLLCQDFEEHAAGVHIGPTCGLVWLAREWTNSWTSNRILSTMLMVPVALLTAPIRYLDYLLVRTKRSHYVASAVFFRGRKLGRER